MRADGDIAILSFTPRGDALLTDAERDVASAAARGLSNRDIATLRGSSTRTVANQLAAIMKKLEVSSRAELAARFGVLDLL